ncbi:uncharacterized protein LOC122498893 [Leptopilina heterotoma]|uniref:uncharacterized protein LOC122498893 n=1 Tax=Leptopilina heterotoma TaxID=63436 RepID=UPI001CA831C3|nr:uncharacterized protein LOC122498893 [Leptopilina heterotoma]
MILILGINMPLFTILDSMRKKKFLISGDTINNIIIKASEKINLPSQEYKLVLEQNGAIMDEDEFLSVLPVLTDILILEKEEEWQTKEEMLNQNKSLTHTAEYSFNGEHVEEQISVRTEVPNVTAVYERRSPFSFPWTALPDTMKEKLEMGKTLSDKECRDLRQILGIHMVGTLKDFRRNTVSSLVNIFVNKYPQALEIIDADGEKLGDGRDVFVIRLYDHINYKKPSNEKTARKRRADTTIDELENNTQSHIENVVHDEYGCVAYQSPLPFNETKMSQEEKRLELVEKRKIWINLNKDETIQKEIASLMDITYATQRTSIIDRKIISEVLEKWPCLQDVPFFVHHASTLFGKNSQDVWNNQIESKGLDLFHFF